MEKHHAKTRLNQAQKTFKQPSTTKKAFCRRLKKPKDAGLAVTVPKHVGLAI
jgi:hypothetical protein